jgi:hypothetical protein
MTQTAARANAVQTPALAMTDLRDDRSTTEWVFRLA